MSDRRLGSDEQSVSPPVDRCYDCEQLGRDIRAKLDTRVRVNGRGLYVCPECKATWQDADEPQRFSDKDYRI